MYYNTVKSITISTSIIIWAGLELVNFLDKFFHSIPHCYKKQSRNLFLFATLITVWPCSILFQVFVKHQQGDTLKQMHPDVPTVLSVPKGVTQMTLLIKSGNREGCH